MKKQVIVIGNQIYYRINRTKAKAAYKHGYDILLIPVPKKIMVSPYGLEWYVLNKNSGHVFDDLVNACTIHNASFYMQLDHVKIDHGTITEARAKHTITEVF